MKIYIIRHGKTLSNEKHLYCGRTDEELTEAGAAELVARDWPPIDRVLVSPAKRCRQTADIVCPGALQRELAGLWEMDFGLMEGRGWEELSGYAFYRDWLASGCTAPIPDGESREQFIRRTVDAFYEGLDFLRGAACPGVIAHGGTAMALGSHFMGGDYFDYSIKNGEMLQLWL